jgi:hypothetical protein
MAPSYLCDYIRNCHTEFDICVASLEKYKLFIIIENRGGHLMIVGYLAFKSDRIPKVISILLLFASIGYIVMMLDFTLDTENRECDNKSIHNRGVQHDEKVRQGIQTSNRTTHPRRREIGGAGSPGNGAS